ncbi:MAG: hypothetical protein WCF28_00060 [Methanobacterium sp.]|uniref:hypothetical protein n=1 Tax=Methanobacterium sp. TaxID=2164 RepID=UPI003C7288CF
MEITGMGKLNVYYVSYEIKISNTESRFASAFLSNATEEEFKELLDNYLSANEEPNLGLFRVYVSDNGYYCQGLEGEVLMPRD